MNTNYDQTLNLIESQFEKVKNIKELDIVLNNLVKLEKKIQENYRIYFLLGNIMWKKLQIDDAIINFKKCLKINPSFIKAEQCLLKVKKEKLDLITYLMYENPKTKPINTIIKCHQLLQNIKYNLSLDNQIKDDIIIDIYSRFQKIIILEKLDTELEASQTQRNGIVKYNSCKRHFEVFDSFKVIPENCFTCYKVQIQPKTVIELIKIHLLFDNLKLPKNLTRKCMIELRPNIQGLYKAFIYCIGLQEAKDTLSFISPILDKTINNILPRGIKRGCSEFAEEFINFKIIDPANKNFMTYDSEWRLKENIIDENIRNRNQPEYVDADTLNGITIKDALVINNWLYYAKLKGDMSYKLINKNPIYSEYIHTKLKNYLSENKARS